MIYAHLTADADRERREQRREVIDRALLGQATDERSKAQRERAAIERLMNLPGR